MADVQKDLIPSWRKGAKYHRALLDEDGLATGREVTVYKMTSGKARLNEGQLAAPNFAHSWEYEELRDAMDAAAEWDGKGSPGGPWTDYRSNTNGDKLPVPGQERPKENSLLAFIEEGNTADPNRGLKKLTSASRDLRDASQRFGVSAEEMNTNLRKLVNAISEPAKKSPVVRNTSQRLGQGRPVTTQKGDRIEVNNNFASKTITLDLWRIEAQLGSAPEEVHYRAKLDGHGMHGDFPKDFFREGARYPMMEIDRKPISGEFDPVQVMGEQDPEMWFAPDGRTVVEVDGRYEMRPITEGTVGYQVLG